MTNTFIKSCQQALVGFFLHNLQNDIPKLKRLFVNSLFYNLGLFWTIAQNLPLRKLISSSDAEANLQKRKHFFLTFYIV